MKRANVKKGGDTVNVQLDIEANEAFKLLKEQYGTPSMSEAVIRFLDEKDAELMRIARRRVEELRLLKERRAEAD